MLKKIIAYNLEKETGQKLSISTDDGIIQYSSENGFHVNKFDPPITSAEKAYQVAQSIDLHEEILDEMLINIARLKAGLPQKVSGDEIYIEMLEGSDIVFIPSLNIIIGLSGDNISTTTTFDRQSMPGDNRMFRHRAGIVLKILKEESRVPQDLVEQFERIVASHQNRRFNTNQQFRNKQELLSLLGNLHTLNQKKTNPSVFINHWQSIVKEDLNQPDFSYDFYHSHITTMQIIVEQEDTKHIPELKPIIDYLGDNAERWKGGWATSFSGKISIPGTRSDKNTPVWSVALLAACLSADDPKGINDNTARVALNALCDIFELRCRQYRWDHVDVLKCLMEQLFNRFDKDENEAIREKLFNILKS